VIANRSQPPLIKASLNCQYSNAFNPPLITSVFPACSPTKLWTRMRWKNSKRKTLRICSFTQLQWGRKTRIIYVDLQIWRFLKDIWALVRGEGSTVGEEVQTQGKRSKEIIPKGIWNRVEHALSLLQRSGEQTGRRTEQLKVNRWGGNKRIT